jgi:hypothetical protein
MCDLGQINFTSTLSLKFSPADVVVRAISAGHKRLKDNELRWPVSLRTQQPVMAWGAEGGRSV